MELRKTILALLGLVTLYLLFNSTAPADERPQPEAPAKVQPAPPIPLQTALDISESFNDLQAAYIELQNKQKAFEAAQKQYNDVIVKAHAAQGIPNDCQPRKGQWERNGAPCMVAKSDAKPAK